jgi:tetratricopeptide (TPR) repeat protein
MLSSLLKSLLRYPLDAWRARLARKLYAVALVQKDADNFDGARRHLERAVAMDPRHVGAHHWLGILCARSQAYADSAKHLEQALAVDPANTEIWIDLGNVYALQREYAKAGASYRAAIAAAPDAALAHLNMGFVLKELGSSEEAVAHLRRAYTLAPEMENALRNLVVTLIETDRCDEALAVASKAAERNPASYDAQLSHGLAHQKLHDPVRALSCYDTALSMRADDAELHDNRGTAFLELGRLPEAIASYDRALALRPDFALAAFHRALTHLLLGDYWRGWDSYELRQLNKDYPKHPETYPRWRGSPLAGSTLVIYREQGLGDEIMFASCLPQIMEMAKHCVVECEPRLLGIFRRSFPAATVYASTPDGSLPPEIAELKPDFAIPAGSVPRFIRRELGEFPRHQGYLKADPERVARWRERLAQPGPGLKVGISWTGGVRKTRRALRSIALEQWLPILATPGVRFVSLQYTADAGAAVTALHQQHGIRIEHWAEAIDDYEETAAITCALDLVISVCTAVIHLGGALGRPVWVMAPYSPEWRYGFSGDTMPWYPSVRIFRQPAFGVWDPVTTSVAAELRRLAGASGG